MVVGVAAVAKKFGVAAVAMVAGVARDCGDPPPFHSGGVPPPPRGFLTGPRAPPRRRRSAHGDANGAEPAAMTTAPRQPQANGAADAATQNSRRHRHRYRPATDAASAPSLPLPADASSATSTAMAAAAFTASRMDGARAMSGHGYTRTRFHSPTTARGQTR